MGDEMETIWQHINIDFVLGGAFGVAVTVIVAGLLFWRDYLRGEHATVIIEYPKNNTEDDDNEQ